MMLQFISGYHLMITCTSERKVVANVVFYTQLQKKPISHFLGQLW